MDESNYVLTKKGSEEIRRIAKSGDTIISDYGGIKDNDLLKYLVLQAIAYGPSTFEEIAAKVEEIHKYNDTGLKFWGGYSDEQINSTIKGLERKKLIRDLSDLALWRGTPGYHYSNEGEDSEEKHNLTSEGWIYREM